MVDPCDICGAVGYAELITTCSKCKIAREHVYCMRVYPKEIQKDWLCEFCLFGNDTISPKSGGNKNISKDFRSDASDVTHHDFTHTTSPCNVNQDSSSQACSRRQKPVATGKVKFIPEEEVIKLSREKFALKPGPANSVTFITRKTSVGSKNVIPKISSLAVKPNPSMIPTGHGKIPRHNGVQKSLMINQQAPHSLPKVVSASERKAPITPAKEYDCREQSPGSIRHINKAESCLPVASSGPIKEHIWENQQLMDELMPVKEVETLNMEIVKPTQEAPSAVLPSTLIVGSGGTFHDVDESIRSNVEERDLQSMWTKFKLYHSYLPSSDATWRGGFKFKCAAGSGEFYGGFQAQPPCTVHRKAYKFSLQMPPILEVEPICTSPLLLDLFQNDCPDIQDVALYFFPSDNIERSRQNLNSVFELMNVKNSMLKCAINGVELLVFTSKQLNVDSQGTVARINAGYFLWGVFRRVKYDKTIERFPDMEAVDMEIDMLGGLDVGRIDHVMQDKPKNLSISSGEGAVLQRTFKRVDEKMTISFDFNTNVQDKFALPTELRKKMKTVSDFRGSTKEYSKTMDELDAPPGFKAKRRDISLKTPVKEEKNLL